jgi:hypothetical protein
MVVTAARNRTGSFFVSYIQHHHRFLPLSSLSLFGAGLLLAIYHHPSLLHFAFAKLFEFS